MNPLEAIALQITELKAVLAQLEINLDLARRQIRLHEFPPPAAPELAEQVRQLVARRHPGRTPEQLSDQELADALTTLHVRDRLRHAVAKRRGGHIHA